MKLTSGLVLSVAVALALPAWGQNGSATEEAPRVYRFGASVDAVHLAATVLKKGRLVNDLEKEDFVVYEDGVPQEIEYFARGADAPVDILLLVDASGSMEVVSKVANARSAAMQLIRVLGPEDRVAVYGFDRDIFELCPFTENKEKALSALERVEPFGTTAIHDAVAKIAAVIEHEGFGRRAVVLITDGIDTASQLSVEQAVEAAKGVDLPVYAIRVLSPLDDPANEAFVGIHGESAKAGDALERFALDTGGKLYEASEIELLGLAALRVKEELKTQYRLAYVPRNPSKDGRFRKIEVFVRQKDVEVRTRKGYYTKKTGADLDGAAIVSAKSLW